MAWAPDYITADELAVYLRIDDDLDDLQLARAVTAGSRAIDRHCTRQFGLVAAPEVREYTPRWSKTRGWLVPIDDLMTSTGLVVAVDTAGDGSYATTLAAAEFVKRPRNAAVKSVPWTELAVVPGGAVCPRGTDGEVRVTARFGWTSVPAAVAQAALLQASRIFARRDAPFGVAGSPEAGSEMRLLAKVDPDVAVTLDPYRRRVWVT